MLNKEALLESEKIRLQIKQKLVNEAEKVYSWECFVVKEFEIFEKGAYLEIYHESDGDKTFTLTWKELDNLFQ